MTTVAWREQMPAEVLRLHGVGVSRDRSMLIRDVNWTVRDDESWVVVGPNGAGKTTLLQVVSGLIPPTEGMAEVLGEPVNGADLADLRSRVGISSAAVAEQVPRGEKVIDLVMSAGYGILGRGTEDYEAPDMIRAVELLDAVGCAHLIRRQYGTLSEGERKRVQIARSLMADPELLLLDEPAAGLDLGGREEVLSQIAALVRDPSAPVLVLVTHHVEEVPEGITHAMLMRRGIVLAAGPVEQVFTERNLSRCFGVPLIVERHADRWMAFAAPVSLSRPLPSPGRAGSRAAPLAHALLCLRSLRSRSRALARDCSHGVGAPSPALGSDHAPGIAWLAGKSWRSSPRRSRPARSTPSSVPGR